MKKEKLPKCVHFLLKSIKGGLERYFNLVIYTEETRDMDANQ